MRPILSHIAFHALRHLPTAGTNVARALAVGIAIGWLSPAMAQPAANDSPAPAETYIKTDSGLQYADIKVGSGRAAYAGSFVSVHYTGWLKSRYTGLGKQFDTSRDTNQPFQFVLGTGGVIAGWDEGVQGMQPGGVRKLIVPPALGYGAHGAGASIPPNATLVFEVELLDVK